MPPIRCHSGVPLGAMIDRSTSSTSGAIYFNCHAATRRGAVPKVLDLVPAMRPVPSLIGVAVSPWRGPYELSRSRPGSRTLIRRYQSHALVVLGVAILRNKLTSRRRIVGRPEPCLRRSALTGWYESLPGLCQPGTTGTSPVPQSMGHALSARTRPGTYPARAGARSTPRPLRALRLS